MLLEDEGHKRTKRKAEAQAGQTLPPLGAADGPPVKRRKSEGKLTVAQLEEKSKVNVGRQRKNFKPLPSWEVLTCVGNYWQKKRAQVFPPSSCTRRGTVAPGAGERSSWEQNLQPIGGGGHAGKHKCKSQFI